MDPYEQLAADARAIRDKAMQSARAEYKVAIRRINNLRRQLTGEAPLANARGDGSMIRRLIELLPTDSHFTITEATEAMHADSVGRHFAANSIRSAFAKLRMAGKVQRVGRRNGHVLWATPTAKVEVCPFGGATLADIAEQLLREHGPMRVSELVVEMKERGYRPDEKPGQTARNMLRALTRFSGRFERGEDGRWQTATL